MKVEMQREFERGERSNHANRRVRSGTGIGVCAERRRSAAEADDRQTAKRD
jgi:hypothetical protein